jgi:hypothetical protein
MSFVNRAMGMVASMGRRGRGLLPKPPMHCPDGQAPDAYGNCVPIPPPPPTPCPPPYIRAADGTCIYSMPTVGHQGTGAPEEEAGLGAMTGEPSIDEIVRAIQAPAVGLRWQIDPGVSQITSGLYDWLMRQARQVGVRGRTYTYVVFQQPNGLLIVFGNYGAPHVRGVPVPGLTLGEYQTHWAFAFIPVSATSGTFEPSGGAPSGPVHQTPQSLSPKPTRPTQLFAGIHGVGAPTEEEVGLGALQPHDGLDFASMLQARIPCAAPGWLLSTWKMPTVGSPPFATIAEWEVPHDPNRVPYRILVQRLPDGSMQARVTLGSLFAMAIYSCGSLAFDFGDEIDILTAAGGHAAPVRPLLTRATARFFK